MKRFTTALLFLLCVGLANAKESITVDMQKPQSQQDIQAVKEIKESEINQTIIDLSDTLFPFNKTLHIQYGNSDGPYYDPNKHTIYIPYSFYLESLNYFTKNGYEEQYGRSAKEGAIDTLLHTLLHEAGHAYIADQKIPVLGKEEDAVDNFATVILLNYVESGDDIAISAGDMFAFESESADLPDYYQMSEYAGEHSFDLQRYFSTLCLVYGSNPEKHQYLLDEVENDNLEDRKDYCVFNFDLINDNWHHYLSVKD